MVNSDFWSVELGRGMGPFSFGMTIDQVVKILRDNQLDKDMVIDEEDVEIYFDDLELVFAFSQDGAKLLRRIDIDDDRMRFGDMEVHFKPVHEIVELLSIPESETLWCDHYDEQEQKEFERGKKVDASESDQELLQKGTLWITTLGLGMSLVSGDVFTVHLCDPDHVPRFGTGQWTAAQCQLSKSDVEPIYVPTNSKTNRGAAVLTFLLMVALGWLAWTAIGIQRQWDALPEVKSRVVATNPPPPEPFPREFTVAYTDAAGAERQATFPDTDIIGLPQVGDEIPIKYMPDSPDKPLAMVRYRDIGMDFAMPIGFTIFGIYVGLQFVLSVVQLFMGRISRPRVITAKN